MIPFNVPPYTGNEKKYITAAIDSHKICGDGEFTKKCHVWFEKNTKTKKALLTTSCTHALEMASILCNIQAGDEVIMPSYTFVSTANSFVLRGAKIIFVDIRPDTMNIDEKLIESAITNMTKVIVPVHYAGVSCEMDEINKIAKKHKLLVVEDAAQGVMSKYKNKPLGTLGDFGCYSFHETKNYSSGEGGLLLIKNKKYIERAEIIREKGTNRSKFFRGQVDKYTWMDVGSSYLPSEFNAAYLYAQLEVANKINKNRLKSWNLYYKKLKELEIKGKITLPIIPKTCTHNAHMFYIKCENLEQRTKLITFLKESDILSVFHYIPLHSSPAGKRFGVFHGKDNFTTKESERILRLPMYYNIKSKEINFIVSKINNFYGKN
jgi:dTDP-4-amino-4,6-dideoxygalactose transaminase